MMSQIDSLSVIVGLVIGTKKSAMEKIEFRETIKFLIKQGKIP